MAAFYVDPPRAPYWPSQHWHTSTPPRTCRCTASPSSATVSSSWMPSWGSRSFGTIMQSFALHIRMLSGVLREESPAVDARPALSTADSTWLD